MDFIFPCRKIILQHIREMLKIANEREDWSEIRLTWFKVAVLEYTEVEGERASSSGLVHPTAGLECPKTHFNVYPGGTLIKNLSLSLFVGSLPLNWHDVIRLLRIILIFD